MAKPIELHSGAALRLALLALTVPIVLASAVFIWQDHNARRDAIITQVNLKSAQVNAQLEDFVHKVDGATGVFAATWVNGHGPKAVDSAELDTMNSYLSRFVENRPHFTGAFVTDVRGTIVASSDPSLVGDRLGGAELYDGARSRSVFTASDVIKPEEEAPSFALFLQPLRWDSAAPQGFLVTRAELSTISGVLDMSVGFPESAKSGIFDSKGRILAGTGYEAPHPGLAAGRDISKSAVWAQAAERPAEEWFGPGLDKVQRIIFFSYPDSTPWVATVAYAQSELFGPLWKRLWTFGGVLAVTLAATVWVGETLIRRDRRRVATLEKERVTLDAVMNGATDGIMVVDADNAVNFVNRRLTEMIGLDTAPAVRLALRGFEGGKDNVERPSVTVPGAVFDKQSATEPVIPAKAGIQSARLWIPASAGRTGVGGRADGSAASLEPRVRHSTGSPNGGVALHLAPRVPRPFQVTEVHLELEDETGLVGGRVHYRLNGRVHPTPLLKGGGRYFALVQPLPPLKPVTLTCELEWEDGRRTRLPEHGSLGFRVGVPGLRPRSGPGG